MKMNGFTGTGALIRLILRRDRFLLLICIVLPALLAIVTAAGLAQIFPTAELRQVFASEVASSPAEVALLGPMFAPTIGGLTAWRWSIMDGMLVGLGSMLFVVRHTRTEEEAGRFELLGSTVVGRNAALSASMIVTLGADLVVGALVACGLIGIGLPIAGSVALGLSAAAIGWTFAAVAGVAAQLTESAGAARGIAVVVLGLSYLLRAVGDMDEHSGMSLLSWLSPIGWMSLIRPFADERWWIFVLFISLVIVLTAAAFAISSRRDVGAGILRPRLGPAAASPRLRSPLALAWRLHRGTLLAWTAGFAVYGAVFGGFAKTASDQLAGNLQLKNLLAQMGGSSRLSDGFFTLVLVIFGQIAAVYAIMATLQMQSEETEARLDPVLATPVSRLRWATSYVLLAAVGTAVVLAAFSLPAGLIYGLSIGKVGYELPRVLAAAMAYLPAIWVMAGIAVALYGLMPRFTFVSWGALLGIILIELLGKILQVNQSILNISPFTHVPKVLVGEVSIMPLIWLAVVAFALTVTGLIGLRRRSIG
ncbi:MAG: ABC transporter permease [Halobacteriota archaeon]